MLARTPRSPPCCKRGSEWIKSILSLLIFSSCCAALCVKVQIIALDTKLDTQPPTQKREQEYHAQYISLSIRLCLLSGIVLGSPLCDVITLLLFMNLFLSSYWTQRPSVLYSTPVTPPLHTSTLPASTCSTMCQPSLTLLQVSRKFFLGSLTKELPQIPEGRSNLNGCHGLSADNNSAKQEIRKKGNFLYVFLFRSPTAFSLPVADRSCVFFLLVQGEVVKISAALARPASFGTHSRNFWLLPKANQPAQRVWKRARCTPLRPYHWVGDPACNAM